MENDRRNYFVINLHESMVPGLDRTRDLSQQDDCKTNMTNNTLDNRQSKTLLAIDERESKIDRDNAFFYHLSPERRQMAIENSVSSDFISRDKWQSKTLFLTIFGLRSPIALTFSIAAYPV